MWGGGVTSCVAVPIRFTELLWPQQLVKSKNLKILLFLIKTYEDERKAFKKSAISRNALWVVSHSGHEMKPNWSWKSFFRINSDLLFVTVDTDKRVPPPFSPLVFVYWFGLQNLRRHMCCRAIKTTLIGVGVIANQSILPLNPQSRLHFFHSLRCFCRVSPTNRLQQRIIS